MRYNNFIFGIHYEEFNWQELTSLVVLYFKGNCAVYWRDAIGQRLKNDVACWLDGIGFG